MKLFTFFRSSAAFRVRIALNLKGLDYEPAFVHLAKGEHRKPEYGELNPQGLVPTLIDDARRLTQSLAIMEYLEEKYPSPPLLPRDLFGRARVRSISLLIACEIHPLNNLRVLQYLTRQLGRTEQERDAWYHHWIGDGLAKVEAVLVRTAGSARFCHADRPTMADCFLVPQIFNAQRFNCDTSHAPTVMRVFSECMELEAFQKAQPSRQPDAE
ncbi:MAG: maleylacetoacetate isomerase [Betaproteobacteria bacterium]|nr:maleylacetoacetate isomerase [Betaproteobacteria bacterium]